MLSKPLFKSLSLSRLMEDLSSIVVPLLLFAGVLTVPSPRWLADVARYDCGFFGMAIALLFFITFCCPGRIGRALSLSVLMMVFALPLARLWHTGASDSFVVGGLLPFSDAAVYYGDARNILIGGTTGEWSPQRPLFSGLLASLLALTQQNLQVALAIVVGSNAIACFFVAREMQKTHGAIVAALVSVQVFFFYRVYIGKALTENLGLALGLLGFAMLWRSAHTKHLGTGLLGLFSLALALNARIGTVFVLPMVILWGAYRFRRSTRFSWLLFLLGGLGAVFLASAMNLILLKLVGLPNGNPPFANFSFTLYGIATHTNWYQVILDYPELNKLGYVDRIQEVYSIAIDIIRQNPWRFVTGLFRGWTEFFFGNYSWFIWEPANATSIDPVFRPLAALGLWSCLRNWKTPAASLLLAMAIGAFLTIPLLPLIDAGVRPYAATIIILFALSALGFRLLLQDILQPLIRWVWRREHGELVSQSDRTVGDRSIFPLLFPSYSRVQGWGTSSALLVFGLTLSLLSFVGPVTLKQFASKPPQLPAGFVCPGGQQVGMFRINPGSGITLVENKAIRQSNLPNIRIKDFRKGLETFSPWATKEPNSLGRFPKNTAIADTGSVWLVAKRNLIPPQAGWVAACGQNKSLGPELLIFQAKTIQPLYKR
jgi:hypothetical protein